MTTEAYDHSSDPNFVAYYAAESQSDATREDFRRVRDRALELLAESTDRAVHDVIDIGCGAGTQAMLWAELGHRVRALDVNEPLVAIGRERAAEAGLEIQFDVGTATALPYADASADVVLLPELLEHVADWERCLDEAVRVLRPGGLLYLSTSSWLCPVQHEFTLPAYSWYPGPIKRWCERRALTTHPQWVNHARYPAVNWFSYYGLAKWFAARGFRTLDRFDMLARHCRSGAAGAAVSAVRAVPPLRLLAHAATDGTTVWALRDPAPTPPQAVDAEPRIKVLYHHRTSAQDGSAVHIDGLIGALRAEGAEVVVVAPGAAAAGNNPRTGVIAKLRRRLPRVVHELLEILYNVPESVRLARAIREHRPDVVYERSNLFLLAGAAASRRAGVPRITEVNAPYFLERSRHGGITLKNLARWTEEAAWRRSDALITVTSELARIVEKSGVDRSRLHVMSNGIDARAFHPAAVDPDAKVRLGLGDHTVLGFTGYVREWNGLETVVDLLARPGNERLFLLVVGDGPARIDIEQRAAERGVKDRVRFTGRVDRDAIAGWVSAFDVALQPAANPYASPLKLFEYMALQRAIVAPDQPNIREVLTNGESALLFQPADDVQFAEAVHRLAHDPALRRRLGRQAAETVRQREMTWSHNARRVTALASRLLREARSPAVVTPLPVEPMPAEWSMERIEPVKAERREKAAGTARTSRRFERERSDLPVV